MASLRANIGATDPIIVVDAPGAAAKGLRFRIDDELLDLTGFDRYQVRGGATQPGVDHMRWIVNRGVGGSVAATHSAGATITAAISASVSSESLTPPDPFPATDAGASAHGDLTGVTSDQHHAQLHAAAHAEGEADEITPAAIGAVANPLTADLETGGFLVRGADVGDDKGGLIEAKNAEAGQGGGITVTGGVGNSTDGIGGEGTFEGGNGWQGGIASLVAGTSLGDGQDGGEAEVRGGSTSGSGGTFGGVARVAGGLGEHADSTGGDAVLRGGLSQGSGVPAQVKAEGMPATSGDGLVEVTTDGSTGAAGEFLGSNGAGKVVWKPQAAFVANGSTVDQLRDSLIAAGLMAAS